MQAFGNAGRGDGGWRDVYRRGISLANLISCKPSVHSFLFLSAFELSQILFCACPASLIGSQKEQRWFYWKKMSVWNWVWLSNLFKYGYTHSIKLFKYLYWVWHFFLYYHVCLYFLYELIGLYVELLKWVVRTGLKRAWNHSASYDLGHLLNGLVWLRITVHAYMN